MTMLSLQAIALSYGGDQVLTSANLEVQSGERVALVGPNGAGKSSLLRIVTGELQADSGQRTVQKGARIGYLAQQPLTHEKTVWEEARAVLAQADIWEQRVLSLREQMAQASDDKALATLAQACEEAQRQFENAGGYAVNATVRRVLHGMAFPESLHELPVKVLSGGQKTRLALAKLLLQEPELLVLDEPTNYLDMETVEWLENYLESYSSAILVVSHDRYFLDRVTHITYELERGRTIRFPAPYSLFAQWKEEERARQADAYEEQQAMLAKMEDFIARNLARATTTKRAQSRRKALEKIERLERPLQRSEASLQFPIRVATGRDVLALQGVRVVQGGRELLPPLNLSIYRGERVAVLGANGVGKTTLLRTLYKQSPAGGKIRLGTQVEMAYYAQELEGMDNEQTVLDYLWNAFSRCSETEIRTRLGQVLFEGEDVYKPCAVLSGGEKSRLALAKLSLTQANVLLLDEPTNHLDLAFKERLEDALLAFEGTLLFVSHDRYFINRLATRILVLTPDGITDVAGDYDDWLAYTRAQATTTPTLQSPSSSELSDNQISWEQRKRLKADLRQRRERLQKTEEKIAVLEEEKAAVEAQLADSTTYDDRDLADRLQKQYTDVTEALDQLYEEWTTCAAQVEEAAADS
ncbi:MAG: ABC-F family ATP-binding cassette domain-containing protein [Firmicutes bacterium]|nr:ABC-F family ATP-binding cassette domain-containing protein [Bacillota bacterium]